NAVRPRLTIEKYGIGRDQRPVKTLPRRVEIQSNRLRDTPASNAVKYRILQDRGGFTHGGKPKDDDNIADCEARVLLAENPQAFAATFQEQRSTGLLIRNYASHANPVFRLG